jgi:hypothetical protein
MRLMGEKIAFLVVSLSLAGLVVASEGPASQLRPAPFRIPALNHSPYPKTGRMRF